MSENTITAVSQAANAADIAAVWAAKPEVTAKSFTVMHTVKDGEEVDFPAGYVIYGTGEKKDEVVETVGEDGRRAATGEKAPIFRGSIDLAPIWDETVVSVEQLRGYAAAGLLLNAQQLFKSRVIAGTAVVGSQDDMNQAFADMLATPAAMQGITPAASKVGERAAKSGGGKVKALEAKLAAIAAKDELRKEHASVRAQIKTAKGADKLALLERLDELDAAIDAD